MNVKQVTVKRQNNNSSDSSSKWYAVVACEFAEPIFQFINYYSRLVGIDVGITKFAHDSENHTINNPLFLNDMVKPLRRASRALSRRQKGSRNWSKAKSRLQILHERIRNKRNNFLHKISTRYCERYDIIFLERLHTLNMAKNHRLARHILDSGWGTFKSMLQYKGKLVVEVPSRHTTVDCSRCGNKVPKTLAVRIHRCNACGLVIDRGYNASLNIKQRGLQQMMLPQQQLPVERREVTPVEIPKESMKQESLESTV